jgi:hypothetical protein
MESLLLMNRGEIMLLILKPLIVGLIVILFLLIFNLVLAVSIALKFGKFDWAKFLDYMKSGLLPYILIWVFLAAVGVGIPYLVKFLGYDIGLATIIPIDSIIGIVWLTIVGKAVADIYKSFKDLEIEIKNGQSI